MYADLPAASAAPLGEPRYGFVFDGLPMVLGPGVLTELVDDLALYPVPRSHPGLAGVLNLRGTIVPVFSPLSARSARHSIHPQQRRALVLGQGTQRAGLLLDTLPQLLHLHAPQSAVPPLAGPYAACSTSSWAASGHSGTPLWWEMDLAALLQLLAA